jgi:hypothetical protein
LSLAPPFHATKFLINNFLVSKSLSWSKYLNPNPTTLPNFSQVNSPSDYELYVSAALLQNVETVVILRAQSLSIHGGSEFVQIELNANNLAYTNDIELGSGAKEMGRNYPKNVESSKVSAAGLERVILKFLVKHNLDKDEMMAYCKLKYGNKNHHLVDNDYGLRLGTSESVNNSPCSNDKDQDPLDKHPNLITGGPTKKLLKKICMFFKVLDNSHQGLKKTAVRRN